MFDLKKNSPMKKQNKNKNIKTKQIINALRFSDY